MAKEKRPGKIMRLRASFARWFAWDFHKNFWEYVGENAGRYLGVHRNESTETFAEAAQRFGLTEADLLLQEKSFWRLSMVSLISFFLMLSYAIYMAINLHFRGAIVAAAMCGFPIGLAVRYHFWYFRSKNVDWDVV